MGVFDENSGVRSEQKPQSADKLGVLSEIETYWQALRHNQELPCRAEIDPRGFEGALRHAFILERMAPGVARFRITGGSINDLLGLDARGLPVTALLSDVARDPFRGLIEDVFQGPARARLRLISHFGAGRPELTAEMLLLPLRSEQGNVTGIFGGLEIDQKPVSGRRRFDLESSFLRVLRAPQGTRRVYPRSGAAPVTLAPETLRPSTGHLQLVAQTPQGLLQRKTGPHKAAPLQLIWDRDQA